MPPSDVPGQRLGLPLSGAGAVAGWGRRIVAIVIDWFIALLSSNVLVGTHGELRRTLGPLVVLFVELSIMTILSGSSIGQRITGVAVRTPQGGPLPPARVLLRSLLLCLAIPAVVYDRDQRGLHDLAAGSITVRR